MSDKMILFQENLPTYKIVDHENGFATIQQVPIFTLGEHRNVNYDMEWWEKTKAEFEELKSSGFFPTIIKGHTSDDDKEEKKSVGLLDNITLIGQTIFADMANIGKEALEEIKQGLYPYRSPEVSKDGFFFSALALLGGSRPYFKFPPLNDTVLSYCEKFSAVPIVSSFMYNDHNVESIKEWLIQQESREYIEKDLRDFRELNWAATDMIERALIDPSKTPKERHDKARDLMNEWVELLQMANEEISSYASAKTIPKEGTKMADEAKAKGTVEPKGPLSHFTEPERAAVDTLVEKKAAEMVMIDNDRFVAEEQAKNDALLEVAKYKQEAEEAKTAQEASAAAAHLASMQKFVDDMASGSDSRLVNTESNIRYALAPVIAKRIPVSQLAALDIDHVVKFKDGDEEKEASLGQFIIDLFVEAAEMSVNGTLLVPTTTLPIGDETEPSKQPVQQFVEEDNDAKLMAAAIKIAGGQEKFQEMSDDPEAFDKLTELYEKAEIEIKSA